MFYFSIIKILKYVRYITPGIYGQIFRVRITVIPPKVHIVMNKNI